MTKPVLIDTSAWIEFFRKKDSKIANMVESLIENDLAALNEPIQVEILSGVKSMQEFNKLKSYLDELHFLSISQEDIWEKIALSRFHLARKGFQAAIIDLSIAWTAAQYNIPLLTQDEDFTYIQKEIPVKLVNIKRL